MGTCADDGITLCEKLVNYFDESDARTGHTVCSENLGCELETNLRVDQQQDLVLAVIVLLEVFDTIDLIGVRHPYSPPLTNAIIDGNNSQRLLLVEDSQHV